MPEMRISQVATQAGLRPSAIRYYEAQGLLPEPRRVGGKRRYDAAVLDQLAVIQLAQEAGFTLAEIRTLLSGFSARLPASRRWRTLAERKLPEVEALIARAQTMKRMLETLMECRCLDLEECGRASRRVAGRGGECQ